LAEFHLNADLVPSEYRSEGLAEALADRVAGRRVLLARADRGREVLQNELSKAAAVDQVIVYRQVDAAPPAGPALDAVRRGEIDLITLTSGNVARVVLGSVDEIGRDRVLAGKVRIVTISALTTAAVNELGYKVAAEAHEATVDGLTRALLELV
jgi:uroporphyrinogen III methyltransferase/synthase